MGLTCVGFIFLVVVLISSLNSQRYFFKVRNVIKCRPCRHRPLPKLDPRPFTLVILVLLSLLMVAALMVLIVL